MAQWNKWARAVIELQREDGSWGCFHTLSMPTKARPMTTEQALRRLCALGFTKDDPPIKRALNYLKGCLDGTQTPPDNREKALNWDAFEAHMFATWIRIFEPDDPLANSVAQKWAKLVSHAFEGGAFDAGAYEAAYRACIPKLHAGERLISLTQFYMVNLLKGMLDERVESLYLDYVISFEGGIYYVYGNRIADLPESFASLQTLRYISALHQFSGYVYAPEKLRFAADWLNLNRDESGGWDLGSASKDGVYLPLSESWRRAEDRKQDCTQWVGKVLKSLVLCNP